MVDKKYIDFIHMNTEKFNISNILVVIYTIKF